MAGIKRILLSAEHTDSLRVPLYFTKLIWIFFFKQTIMSSRKSSTVKWFTFIVVLFYVVIENSFSGPPGAQHRRVNALVSVYRDIACCCPHVIHPENHHCPLVGRLNAYADWLIGLIYCLKAAVRMIVEFECCVNLIYTRDLVCWRASLVIVLIHSPIAHCCLECDFDTLLHSLIYAYA